jgi:hypothetical protein
MTRYLVCKMDATTMLPPGQELCDVGPRQLSGHELDQVSGGYGLMQWEYTKQDDTGAAKATAASKIS